MKDVTKQVVKAMITKIGTLISGRTVYTQLPKSDSASMVTYPYIYLSDFYQTEDGPKNSYWYRFEMLVQIVYKDVESRLNLWSDKDYIMQIINNTTPFTIDDGFVIESCELLSSTETDILTDTGLLSIGLIRINFKIR